MMFGFTFLHYSGLTTDTRGSDQNRWMSIDPEKVYYYNERTTEEQRITAPSICRCGRRICSGYVYMATMDGDLYIAPSRRMGEL